jgi:hypothetical protein
MISPDKLKAMAKMLDSKPVPKGVHWVYYKGKFYKGEVK